MGFLSQFMLQTSISESILPQQARNLILLGKLPNIAASRIILKPNEICHYVDRAILNKTKTHRISYRKNVSMPGLFKDTRVGIGQSRPKEYEEIIQYKGILYITNYRVIFQSNESGFEKTIRSLSVITPYSNAIQLQFGNSTFEFIVPDGVIVDQVVHSLCNQ